MTQTTTNDWLNDCIAPHTHEVFPIIKSGEVAVVVCDHEHLAASLGTDNCWDSATAADMLGWDRKAAVFELSGCRLRTYTAVSTPAAASWLGCSRPGRILLFSDAGIAFVRFVPGVGFEFEPWDAEET